MKPIAENVVIQIEITNACHLKCANCTRHVGHHRKPFFMALETVRQAIDSLQGFPGRIGCMGGDPTMHPKFREVLAIFREMIPDKRKREFWTAGWKWDEYKDDINATFDPDLIHYNDHTQSTGRHQPLLVASEEVVPNDELREALIDDCWVQRQWSASITPKGAFFCEVAASLHHLFDGPEGWPIEPGWWRKVPADYWEQRGFACGKCSAAIPMETRSDARGGRDKSVDVLSPGNLERLRGAGSPKVARGGFELDDWVREADDLKKDGWTPSKFRDFVAHNPEDVAEATKGDA